MCSSQYLVLVLALTALNSQFSTSRKLPKVNNVNPHLDPSAFIDAVDLGNFTHFASNFSTAQTTVLNEKQVLITNVWYDGLGPAAHWIVSNSNKTLEERPNYTSADYTIIPDETGSCGVLKAYKGQDVTLTLPENLNFSSVQYISMYCVQFDHNFGYIPIPDNISLPDYTGNAVPGCDPVDY